MGKFLKSGKVVILLGGRFAGKKAVIVRNHDDGTKDRPYGHGVVVGIEKYPLKVTRSMGAKRVSKRSKIKPFIKVVNLNHMMPTRYTLDMEQFKDAIAGDVLSDSKTRQKAKKEIKKILQQRFQTGKNEWFFQKLRF